jgi:hypothetical protein
VETLAYPLQVNTIRRNSKHNASGMVRNNHHRPHQRWDLLAMSLTSRYAEANGTIEDDGQSSDYGKCIPSALMRIPSEIPPASQLT